MRTFLELQQAVFRKLSLDITDTANADILTDTKLALNVIQEQCNKDRAVKKLLIKKDRVLTEAVITTGTVSVVNASRNVSFSSAILTDDFKGRLFVCDDTPDVEYRIESITSTQIAVLDVPYAGDTNTAATHQIFNDRYYLGRDVLGVW